MSTIILGSSFLWAILSGLGLFFKEASQARDLGDKPVTLSLGLEQKVDSGTPSNSEHVGQGPGHGSSSSCQGFQSVGY